MRKCGLDVVVDHIYPLQHSDFSGLHVHLNLQIIGRLANARKSNVWHPSHPQMPLDWAIDMMGILDEQLELRL